ncbi:glycosyltransferase family 2 protein [Enterococcus sp. AZ163]|uniref:glycosyltransferase family 2 protein n=1 Tax=Enterococcus sp. AZ163 TaxID=2774638 RepID=UPI003D2908A8
MKEEKILVSIVLAAYNVEKYIGKCLDTIVNQTYNNLEIIVVNDGSPDNSQKIVEEYAKKDNRVKLVCHEKNEGLSAARNTGLAHAQGDFVSFVDSDDYLAEDFVEYMLKIYIKTNADLCLSMNIFTTKDKKQITHDNITTLSSEKAVAELLYPRIRMGVWNKLWRHDFIVENKLKFIPGQSTGEGLTFMTNAAQYINCAGVGQRKVYCYRLDNENSATTKPNVEKQGIGALEAMEIIENNLDFSSPIVRHAFDYQMWSTSTYALRQIIDANKKDEYYSLFNDLVKYIRKNSLKMLHPSVDLPLRMRMIAICRWVNPIWITKLSLYLRNRHLKNS